MTATEHDRYLDGLRHRFRLDTYIRRAVGNRLHNSWAESFEREQRDRLDRLDTIMTEQDFEMARRFLVTPADRARVREVLDGLPATIRGDLDTQQHKLSTDVYRHLGAEHRRRVAEVRCWVIDAIDCIDGLDFGEARRLIVDAEHSLSFLLNARPQNDRPSRSKMEFDPPLRERTQRVITSLRHNAMALREVAR